MKVRRNFKLVGASVTKKKKNKANPTYKPHGKEAQVSSDFNKPWISLRTGLYLVTFASLVMFGLTAYQVTPEKGIFQGILWGLLFGGMIWAVFWGFYFFRKIFH
jgi:hypothetical protein